MEPQKCKMTAEESEKLLRGIKVELKALVVSSQNQIAVGRLNNDFRAVNGSYIPFQAFGFANLVEFLKSIPDCVQVFDHGGHLYVRSTYDEQTEHIQRLVNGQKNRGIVPGLGRPQQKESATAQQKGTDERIFYTDLPRNVLKIRQQEVYSWNNEIRIEAETNGTDVRTSFSFREDGEVWQFEKRKDGIWIQNKLWTYNRQQNGSCFKCQQKDHVYWNCPYKAGDIFKQLNDCVYIKVQQRTACKLITTVIGIGTEYSLKKIVRYLQKECHCTGTVLGNSIQLTGNQAEKVKELLIKTGYVKEENCKIHDFI